jgi:hypothetical protein
MTIVLYFNTDIDLLKTVDFRDLCTHQPALGPRGGLWPVLLVCDLLRRPRP